jgi:hypothetical protein
MNAMLMSDIAMFSGHENCRRAPPEARSVDAYSYVSSGSTTATRHPGASDVRKYATLEPITAPPTIATSYVICV